MGLPKFNKMCNYYDYERGRRYSFPFLEAGALVYLTWSGMPRDTWSKMLKDVQGLEGARYKPDMGKCWQISHPKYSSRNAFILGLMTNGEFPDSIKEPLKRYEDVMLFKNAYTTTQKYPDNLPKPTRDCLHFHQREMFGSAVISKRYDFAVAMGLGKSIVIIELMEYAKRLLTIDGTPATELENKISSNKFSSLYKGAYSDLDYFWVVAPKNVLDSWYYELKKWKAIVRPRLIVNSVQAITKAMESVDKPPLFLAIDEIHNFSNARSQRSQQLLQLSDLMAQYWEGSEYVLGASGTPAPKNPTAWWSQLEIIKPGWFREKNQQKMLETLANLKKQEVNRKNASGDEVTNSFSVIESWKKDEVARLYQRIRPITSVYKIEDCVNLPDYLDNTVRFDIAPEVKAAAKIILETESHGGRALQKLRQLSDGFLYENVINEDEEVVNRNVTFLETPKDTWITNRLEECLSNDRTRLVIYAAYRASIDKLTRLCITNGWNVIRVDGRGRHFLRKLVEHKTPGGIATTIDIEQPFASQEQFQDLNLDAPIVWLAHPASGGVGVTLYKAKEVIFYSNTFNADHRTQSKGRLRRLGMSEDRPIVTDLIHLPTDDLIIRNLEMKRNLERITMGEVLTAYDELSI